MLRNFKFDRPLNRLAACLIAALTLGLLHRVGAAQEPRYDGHRQTSFHVTVRDGTKLAVDLVQPTRSGNVATERLPVVVAMDVEQWPEVQLDAAHAVE